MKPKTPIALVSLLLLAACSPSEPEATSESQAAAEPPPSADASPGGDPVVLDPDHYTTEFENDAVRVVRIKYGAGEESVMHYHPDSVAVFVTDIEGEMTLPDGTNQPFASSAGAAVFNAAGDHLPKNTSDADWEVVEIELKPRDSAGGEPGGPDPTVVDPDHYTTEFENDAVRIVRIKYNPGEESVMHYHPDSVAVFMTDNRGQMTMPDGSTTETEAKAGDVVFNRAGQHLPKNRSDSGSELVLVELK